jgi:hypothetical protein
MELSGCDSIGGKKRRSRDGYDYSKVERSWKVCGEESTGSVGCGQRKTTKSDCLGCGRAKGNWDLSEAKCGCWLLDGTKRSRCGETIHQKNSCAVGKRTEVTFDCVDVVAE